MKEKKEYIDVDLTASSRKQDHISLSFKSQQNKSLIDQRFYYEPLLSPHISDFNILKTNFGAFQLDLPLWVSSMTGGTEKAKHINHNLAKACGVYGMGMGLGSCRSLLFSDEYLSDFNVKHLMPDFPLFANLGIAQVEILAKQGDWQRISTMISKLHADGLIIHVNPLQEWLQPEGDRFEQSPLDTIKRALDNLNIPIIVKEVGQGMGPKSLKALLELPLMAVEFAASGGTNFATIELFRADPERQKQLESSAHLGHTAEEMVVFVNQILNSNRSEVLVSDVIISGGVKDYLDSYYLRNICQINAISGHASSFLKYALEGYDELCQYIEIQREGLLMAESFLNIKMP